MVVAALVAALAMLSLAALRGWEGWLQLRRIELAEGRGRRRAPTPAAARLELADLKDRVRRLELEITESVLLEDNVQSNSLIKEFQKIGLKLSLDDFGTGYSSLSYLKKYRFHKIKIDTSFIADVTRSKEARAIIHALVGLAAELDMEIVAEGIETETQLGYVTGARCTAAQGFYLGRPAPREVIGRRLAAQQRGERWTGKEGTEAPKVRLKAARG